MQLDIIQRLPLWPHLTATVKSLPHAAIALALTPGMLAVRTEPCLRGRLLNSTAVQPSGLDSGLPAAACAALANVVGLLYSVPWKRNTMEDRRWKAGGARACSDLLLDAVEDCSPGLAAECACAGPCWIGHCFKRDPEFRTCPPLSKVPFFGKRYFT